MEIGKLVVSSLKWIAVAKFAAQLVTWTVTIFVIRILEPSDYGILAMAVVITGVIGIVNDIGLGDSIVQNKGLGRSAIEKIFGLLIIINLSLFIGLYFLSPYVAQFFNEPLVSSVLRVVTLELLLIPFLIIPKALLTRKMNFKVISISDFSRAVIASLATLAMALSGFGVWSLVFGNLLGVAIEVIIFNSVVRTWYRPRFSIQEIKQPISFGSKVTAGRVLWYLNSEADLFIIGKFLGKELLGIYSIAKQLVQIPMAKISQMLNQVVFSAFSKIQDNRSKVAEHFLKSAHLMSFISFPVFFGISSVSTEFVDLVLGEKLKLATIPFQILSLILPLRMLQNVFAPTLDGIGKPKINIVNQIIACVIMPGSIFIGLKWGLEGVCLAWIIAYPIYFVIVLVRSLPAIGVKLSDYFNAIRVALLHASIMYLAVWLAREYTMQFSIPLAAKLFMLIFVGAITYLSLTWFFQRNTLIELKELANR